MLHPPVFFRRACRLRRYSALNMHISGGRKHVIAEARRRLLEEHAGRLAGYMPGNILKNAEDAALFKRLATKPREFEYIL